MKNQITKTSDKIKKSEAWSPLNQEIIHNILNPLSGLILYLELNSDNENLKKIISPIAMASEKIRSFIKEISFSLENKNRQEIVNIENHLAQIIEIMSPKALAKNVSFTFIRKYNVNLLITNSLKIYEIFINLISNSLDAFEKINDNRKKIINIIVDHDKANNLLIKIYDNGCGIEKHNYQKIFKNNFTTREKGLGIGLYNTQKIIREYLGGQISVKSTIGQYTIFSVKIPKKRIINTTDEIGK
jgi:two-component system NtrC family sensor kinase